MNRYLIILIVFLFGCLESFEPDIPDNDQGFIVIDGVITDQPGPYSIIISKSSGLDGENEPVTGITDIFIQVESGESEQLMESMEGIYLTDLLQGEVGGSYRLNFTYDDQQYQSTWETILPSPVIGRVYFEEEARGTTSLDVDLKGLQFFVDSNGEISDAQHFRYEWEETWEFNAPAPALFNYLGEDSIELNIDPPLDVCWRNANSVGINLVTTENLTENVLFGHPLGFASGEQRYTVKYSLLVRQFVFDEKEFIFWKSLKESNEELGSLFDRQPAKVLGNVANINNAAEPVLGYFSTSGVSEKRIFIDESQVSEGLRLGLICAGVEVLLKEDLNARYETVLFERLDDDVLFFDFIYRMESPIPIGSILVPPECADCTLIGGVPDKPFFWDE